MCFFLSTQKTKEDQGEKDLEWAGFRALPTVRSFSAAVVIGNSLYLFGGVEEAGTTARVDVFDRSTNSWSRKSDMPSDVKAHTATLIDNKVYIAGGMADGAPLDIFWKYDPIFDSFETLPPLPALRAFHTAAAIDKTLYLFGGSNGTVYDTMIAFDTISKTWINSTDFPVLPFPIYAASAVAVESLIYITGGVHKGSPNATTEVITYDPRSNAFSFVEPMTSPHAAHTAFYLESQHRLFVIGGFLRIKKFTTVVESFDLETRTWSDNYPPLPTTRSSCAGGLVDDVYFVLGGMYESTFTVGMNEGFDPIKKKWLPFPAIPPFISYKSVTQLIDDLVIITGGVVPDTQVHSTQIFNITSNEWLPGPFAPCPQMVASASSAAIGGLLYMFGGMKGSTTVATTRVYDPSTNSWSNRAWMPTPVFEHCAAVYNDEVYNFGGLIESGHTVNHLQIYDSKKDTWRTKYGSMPVEMKGCTAVFHEGLFYLFGGTDMRGTQLTEIIAYNPSTEKWITSGLGSISPRNHAASAVINGKIAIIGGFFDATTLVTVDSFDPKTKQVSSFPDLPCPRAFASAFSLNDSILLVGGSDTRPIPSFDILRPVPSA